VRKRALGLCGFVLATACRPEDVVHRFSWFAAMVHQRSIKPYTMPRDPVPGTVPVTGPAPVISLTTASRRANVRTRTSESINRGKFVYETYCLVCHGAAGRGDGPLSSAAGGSFFGVRSLVAPEAGRLSDGELYGVVSDAAAMGRGLMPRYGDKVRGSDRWDVVNYVRTLQALEPGGGSR
jgi:mono/diheme cytochrome c family protein